MSSPTWQDRRFMFPAGKEVHEPTRRTSMSGNKATDAPKIAAPGGLSTLTSPTSAGGEHASRFMWKTGKEVHEPSRKTSVSGTKATDAPKPSTSPPVPASTSPPASSAASAAAAASRRRRSSAASQGGIFGGLMANRGSEEYTQRRQSWDEMKKPDTGFGGIFGGFINKTTEKK